MKQFNRKPLSGAISLAIAGTALAATLILPAYADEGSLEEVTVTATKRTANLQDVPISIQVLGAKQLEELEIGTAVFDFTLIPAAENTADTISTARAFFNSKWAQPVKRAQEKSKQEYRRQTVLNVLDDGDIIIGITVKRVA